MAAVKEPSYYFTWKNAFGGDPRQFGPWTTQAERDAAADVLIKHCRGWVIAKWMWEAK